MSKISITVGDTDFQKTFTEREKEYVHEGQNWISKFSREINLKALRSIGWTLDEVENLPKEKQDDVWNDALSCWNCQDWSESKHAKECASRQTMGKIELHKK